MHEETGTQGPNPTSLVVAAVAPLLLLQVGPQPKHGVPDDGTKSESTKSAGTPRCVCFIADNNSNINARARDGSCHGDWSMNSNAATGYGRRRTGTAPIMEIPPASATSLLMFSLSSWPSVPSESESVCSNRDRSCNNKNDRCRLVPSARNRSHPPPPPRQRLAPVADECWPPRNRQHRRRTYYRLQCSSPPLTLFSTISVAFAAFFLFKICAPILIAHGQFVSDSEEQIPCRDTHQFCQFWESQGECSNNGPWMLNHCPVSCRSCRSPGAPPPFDGSVHRPHSFRFSPRGDASSVVVDPETSLQQVRDGTAMAQASNTVVIGGGVVGIASPPVPAISAPLDAPRPFPVQPECVAVVQTVEIATRIVPEGREYRNKAFRMGCAIPNQGNICARNPCYHERYRTFDGSCNNLQNPMRGAAYTPYARMLEARYEDGVDRMVGTSPQTLPNPRDVTHLLLSTRTAIPTPFNALLMQFGQFVSHDITRNTVINTCTCSTIAPHCANMPIPRHDTKEGPCIPFTRSIPLCGTGITGVSTPRTPMNENTAFIDGSQIYGSDPKTARELRVGALIRTTPVRNSVFPPPSSTSDNLVTGDSRSNLFIGLAALHTIFVRLHNRIALTFERVNPHWDSDRNFQETRKIIGAIIQVITYREYLPALLGNKFNQLIPAYVGYNPEMEPAISNEFSTAAYRLHGLIREFYRLVNKHFASVGDVRFVEGAGGVRILLSAGTDLLIRGMITITSKRPQRLTTQVTEELFNLSDMGSINIQRGRDQGLREYMAYRALCGLPAFTSFEQWTEVNNVEVRRRVFELYGDPVDVDLYVGGLLEEPVDGSLLGPTFSCIIAEQFRRSRDSDRFFYRNDKALSPAMVAALEKVTFAMVICETGEDFDRVPVNAFLVDDGSKSIPCDSPQISKLDLSPWIELPQSNGPHPGAINVPEADVKK